ncbi:precorrin-3B synthase [Pseudotabrizicola sp. L79]|uniref:precorrin-3B synthase n=1 Tax=Pseudotabrizicola sp. L79 TaxID=3118402 RepID=UPI002F9365E6
MSGARAEFVVQGWCPGALRPMMSGDGLVVRVRPNAGRLTAAQAMGIALAARQHGNGLIDLSARANVQLRGVTAASHPALLDDLRALGLIDADIRAEARRNLLVTPFADAATDDLATRLGDALADAPELPGKFGFAVDTGPASVLAAVSADIRLEGDGKGGLILRCDGSAHGAPVDWATAPHRAVALARWFVAQGGVTNGRGRMAALLARGVVPTGPLQGTVAPASAAAMPGPGLVAQGALVGFEFGQMQAETLAQLAALGDLRVTPWRMVLVEGARALPNLPGLILRADDPLLRVQACTGAPGCVQALRPVRPLARRLAAQVPVGQTLHVSGCAKGCAHPGPAALTLIATDRGFDLVKGGSAQDTPHLTALPEAGLDLKGLA